MPDLIRLEINRFDGCQVFDLRASGHKIACIENDFFTGIFGAKSVFVFEPKESADDLALTIRNVRGDVHVALPITWMAYTNLTSFAELNYSPTEARQFAKVTAERSGKQFDIGIVDGTTLTMTFRKIKEV